MMTKPFMVFEDIEDAPRRRLFRFLGVEWMATDRAWTGLVLAFGLGLGMAILVSFGETLRDQLLAGLGLGAMVLLLPWVHTLGHIASGSLVGAPMDANLITATLQVNLYHGDQTLHPRRVHFVRAIGGPVLNITVGLAALGVWYSIGGNWPVIVAIANLGVGIISLAPIPALDGSVVWGRVLKVRK